MKTTIIVIAILIIYIAIVLVARKLIRNAYIDNEETPNGGDVFICCFPVVNIVVVIVLFFISLNANKFFNIKE